MEYINSHRKEILTGLFFTNLLAILGLWWLGSGTMALSDTAGLLIALGRVAGLLLEYAILLQLLMIGRIPFLEREFGFDKLNQWHRWVGYSLITLLVAHPVLLVVGYGKMLGIDPWHEFINLLMYMEDVGKALLAVIIMVATGAISVAIIRHKLRYETWYFAHLLLYVAIALAFGHQTNTGDMSHGVALYYWLLINFAVFGLVLVYRFLKPFYLYYTHRFVVDRVVPESETVTSIYITGRNMEKFHFDAGQFANFIFLAKGMWFTHPFSFSQDYNGKEIRISVKASGDFTSKIGSLSTGTPVLVDGPLGVFTASKAQTDKIVLVAGGIGITPIRALAETLHKQHKQFQIVYSERIANDAVFTKEFAQLNIPVGLNESSKDGRMTAEKLMELVPDVKNCDVYVCGPSAMIKQISKGLLQAGTPRGQVHFENFAY